MFHKYLYVRGWCLAAYSEPVVCVCVCVCVQWRTEGWFGVFNPPPPRNSEDVGAVLDRMSKKNRRLDFLL